MLWSHCGSKSAFLKGVCECQHKAMQMGLQSSAHGPWHGVSIQALLVPVVQSPRAAGSDLFRDRCSSESGQSMPPCSSRAQSVSGQAIQAYGWICTAAVNPNVANETALACVDDRGYMVPCAFEGSAGGVCGLSAADERELTDGHRRGCAPASCISLPGASPPIHGAWAALTQIELLTNRKRRILPLALGCQRLHCWHGYRPGVNRTTKNASTCSGAVAMRRVYLKSMRGRESVQQSSPPMDGCSGRG
jgi:hypothetical protein